MSESVEQVGAPPVLEVEDLHKAYPEIGRAHV